METRKPTFAAFLRRNGMALLLTVGLFALVYAVVFNFRAGDSDYIDHLLWSLAMSPKDMAASFYNGSERLWHICVKLLFPGVVGNMWTAAAIVTATADAAAYFLVYKAAETAVPEKFPRWLLAMITASVFVVNALTLPGQSFYTGRGAINTWQNPTNLMVRPFAAAVFFMTVRIYNRRRYFCHRTLVASAEDGRPFVFEGSFWTQFREPVYTTTELILYPVCLLLSTYAKPSFLQFFAPAILIFLLIDVIRTRGMLLPFCLKLAIAYIPAGIILLSQFFSFFGTTGIVSAGTAEAAETAAASAGVALYFVKTSFEGLGDFFRVLGVSFLEILYLCAFPLFILLIDVRGGFRAASTRLGFIGMLAARLEALFLHETGSRAAHGNFLWGYYLSAWLLWCTSIGRYIQLLRERSAAGKLARWGGSALLFWHLICGIAYVVKILQTGLYFF